MGDWLVSVGAEKTQSVSLWSSRQVSVTTGVEGLRMEWALSNGCKQACAEQVFCMSMYGVEACRWIHLVHVFKR